MVVGPARRRLRAGVTVGRSISHRGSLAAALLLAAPLPAHAAGLGKLTVLSPLGQPLNAEIEIVSLQPGEEDGLTARARAAGGLPRRRASSSARRCSACASRSSGATAARILRVTSTQPVNEPFLDLLVELHWTTGPPGARVHLPARSAGIQGPRSADRRRGRPRRRPRRGKPRRRRRRQPAPAPSPRAGAAGARSPSRRRAGGRPSRAARRSRRTK